MSDTSLEVVGIHKAFRRSSGWRDAFRSPQRVPALRGVDFVIRPGEIFGLLGPNGAGKTTLVKIISGLVLPDEGTVLVGGADRTRDERASRGTIGVVYGDERTFNWRLTVRDNLMFYAQLYSIPSDVGRRRIEHLLRLVGLEDAGDRRMMAFSSGMRQRAAIARGLLHDPAVVLMDEPTRTLDPVGSHTLHELVRRRIADEGRTVLVATNIMSEAEALCHRLMLLHGGVAVLEGTVAEIRARYRPGALYHFLVTGDEGAEPACVQALPGVLNVEAVAAGAGAWELAVLLAEPGFSLPTVIRALLDCGLDIASVAHQEPSLDEIFRTVVAREVEASVA